MSGESDSLAPEVTDAEIVRRFVGGQPMHEIWTDIERAGLAPRSLLLARIEGAIRDALRGESLPHDEACPVCHQPLEYIERDGIAWTRCACGYRVARETQFVASPFPLIPPAG